MISISSGPILTPNLYRDINRNVTATVASARKIEQVGTIYHPPKR